jgi:hypothetical protein
MSPTGALGTSGFAWSSSPHAAHFRHRQYESPSRSNWANDSSMFRVNRPIEVVELNCWVTKTNDTAWASIISTSLVKSAGGTVDLVDHIDLDLRGPGIFEEPLQGRAVSRSARIAAVVVPVRQRPAVMGLAADIGLGGIVLGVEGLELLVHPILGRDPGMDGAPGPLGGFGGHARVIGLQIQILNASTSNEIGAAFTTLASERPDALFVAADGFFASRRVQFATLAARVRIPAAYGIREIVAAGGLMSYGTSLADTFHQVGVYSGTILKGAKPADVPVVQSTKFEFVINLRTARALGIDVPPTLLAIADEVIE